MSISKYEAASLYDFAHQDLSSKKEYLVLDLDDSSCGYCTCNGKTDIHLNKSWAEDAENLWSVLLESIKKITGSSQIIDLEGEVEKQLISANGVLHNYFLSDRRLNGEVFSFADITVLSAELDEGLSILREKISGLITHAKEMVPTEHLLDTNIIILGKAQELYLTMYYIREQLSYDPMLPDERFRNTEFTDSYGDVVKKGEAIFAELTSLKHSYSILAFDPKSSSLDTVCSAAKGEVKSNAAETVFSEPILLCDGDKISIRVDEFVSYISLPYTIGQSGSDLIDVAIGLNQGEDTLFIRRCRFPKLIYNVKLS